MPDLFFEIGCEEIPAGFLAGALRDLERLCRAGLDAAKLSFGEVRTYGTPRRLALAIAGLADRQPDLDETLVGPPTQAGAKALEGFQKKYGLDAAAVTEQDTEKGRRFVARRQIVGKDTRELLPELLGSLIPQIPWPKSMRWGAHRESFARPVHWIVALFGGEVIPLGFAGIRSGRESRGHRFLAPAPFAVDGAAAWLSGLRERFVLADPAERQKRVEAELARIEKETGLRIRPDAGLLAEVVNLVEYPVGICGSFDERTLQVPEAVIISAMRGHQRYFAMTTPAGLLAHRFVTMAGTVVRDPSVVAHGNERVLRARLADARFFFDEDCKIPLADRAQKLSGVVWMKGLGTVREKVDRTKRTAAALAAKLAVDPKKVERAGEIAKADLLTHVVGEFPELQGFIGSAYAQRAGEDPEVSAAIAEHYQPRGAQDSPARSPVGAVLALADRADSLVGCFAAGLAPTGSADPFGLRRAALGLLQTLLAHDWHFSLQTLLGHAAAQYEKIPAREAIPAVLEFLRGRLRGAFADEFPNDVVDAVLAASLEPSGFDDPVDARARVRALAALRSRPDFEPLGVAIKRVGNILKGVEPAAAYDAALSHEPAEQALAETARTLERKVTPFLQEHAYDEALRVLSELKGPVDHFFEKVFVMDKDERVRNNRLALLASISRLFVKIADFRQLSVGA